MVAKTSWPARMSETAVAKPMPVLDPVTRMVFMTIAL
jgi:hypothetical protein